jgi:hypothetical protein
LQHLVPCTLVVGREPFSVCGNPCLAILGFLGLSLQLGEPTTEARVPILIE